ncbi:MAG: hypothetical protein AB1806_06705 [Acidobacteriota bacterium]
MPSKLNHGTARRRTLSRIAESSVAWPWLSRLTRESYVVRAAFVVFRPTLAYLGGPVAAETEEQSRDDIARLCATVGASVIAGTLRKGLGVLLRIWRSSRTAQLLFRTTSQVAILNTQDRIRLTGWTVLAGTLVAGIIKAATEGPWPWPSMVIWGVVLTCAFTLIVGAHEVSMAWRDFRSPTRRAGGG